MDKIITVLSGDIWATFEAIITIATLVLVVINYYKNKKKNSAINICVLQGDKKTVIQDSVIRQHVTRSEIKGVLNDCSGGSNYEIAYLSSRDFFEQMQKLYKGKTNEFVIKLTENDKYQLKTENDDNPSK